MGTQHRKIEDNEVPPVRHDHPAAPGISALLAAAEHMAWRNDGPEGWEAAPGSDPIAFLLDGVADAVTIWAGESLLYRNHAAQRLEAASSPSRRTLRFAHEGTEYLIELVTGRYEAPR